MFAGAAGVSFTLGVIIANAHTRAKQRRKRERRQRIIHFQRTVTDEICRWDVEHPQLLLTAPKTGRVIFKGDADKMSIEEFSQALIAGLKTTATTAESACRTFKTWADTVKKSC